MITANNHVNTVLQERKLSNNKLSLMAMLGQHYQVKFKTKTNLLSCKVVLLIHVKELLSVTYTVLLTKKSFLLIYLVRIFFFHDNDSHRMLRLYNFF